LFILLLKFSVSSYDKPDILHRLLIEHRLTSVRYMFSRERRPPPLMPAPGDKRVTRLPNKPDSVTLLQETTLDPFHPRQN
jgi:hypothetical protein